MRMQWSAAGEFRIIPSMADEIDSMKLINSVKIFEQVRLASGQEALEAE
jgi:hypothetical protein